MENFEKNDLEILCGAVYARSYGGNLSNKDFDGKTYWQPIKNNLAGLDKFVAKKGWKKISSEEKESWEMYAKSIKKKTSDPLEILSDKVPEHFMRQLYKIPREEEPTIRKIVQLYLNSGQLHGVLDRLQVEKKKNKIQKIVKSVIPRPFDLSGYIHESDIKYLSGKLSKKYFSKL
jgi:hypothetical protein